MKLKRLLTAMAVLAGSMAVTDQPVSAVTDNYEMSGTSPNTAYNTGSVTITATGPNISTDTMGGEATAYSTSGVVGGSSIVVDHDGGSATATFTFSAAVDNPILHIDRLGGNSFGDANTSVWELTTASTTLTRLAGVGHFVVDGSEIQRELGDSSSGTECSTTSSTGTACGSVRVNGTSLTSLTFSISGEPDALEFRIEVPDPKPSAVADSGTTFKETAVTIDWRSNDSMNDGATLNSVDAASTQGGTVVTSGTDSFSYTPAAGFTGSDTFNYQICDNDTPTASCASAAVSVVVYGAENDSTPVNATGAQAIDLASNDTMPAGADYSIVSGTYAGTAVIDPDSGELTYTPAASEAGASVTVVYEVCPDGVASGGAGCGTATVSLDVAAHETSGDSETMNISDGQTVDVAANDPHITTGADFSIVSSDGAGTVSIDPDTGVVSYNPTLADAGSVVSVVYEVCPDGVASGGTGCNTATLEITVNGADIEVATSTSGPAAPGETVTVTVDITNNGPGATDDESTLVYTAPTGTTIDFDNLPAGCVSSDPTVTCTAAALAANGAASFDIPVVVPSDAAGETLFSGGSAVVTNADDPTTTDNSSDSEVSSSPATSVLSSTASDPGASTGVTPGEEAAVVVTTENAGPSDSPSTVVTYTPPTGVLVDFDAIPANCTANVDGVSVDCDLGDLAAGDSDSATIPVIVDSSVAPSSELAGGTVGANSTTAGVDADSATTAFNTGPAEADISISVDAPEAIAPGSSDVVTITVDNTGPSDSGSDTTVIYTPPSGTVVDMDNLASGDGYTCLATDPADGSVTCTVDPLVDGGSVDIDIPVVVDPDAEPGTTASGGSVTASNDDDTTTGNNSSSSSIEVGAAEADLSTVVTDPGATTGVTPGAGTSVLVTTSNAGPSDATSSLVVYTPPTGVSIGGPLPAGCELDEPTEGSVTCDLGTIAAAGSESVEIPVVVDPGVEPETDLAGGSAGATSDATDDTPDSASSSFSTGERVADLAVTVTDEGPTVPGEEAVVTIEVDNLGPSDAPNTFIEYTPPTGVSIVEAALPVGCILDGDTVRCDVSLLEMGESEEFDITVELDSDAEGGTVLTGGGVDAGSDASDPDDSNSSGQSSEFATSDGQADLGISVDSVPTMQPGQSGEIAATVSNAGPSAAGSVDVTYTLPEGVEFDATHANPDGCTVTDDVITCTVDGPIANGEDVSVVIPIALVREQPTSGPITGGEVSLANGSVADPDETSDSAEANPVLDLSGDSDGDGIPDAIEMDPDGAGEPLDLDGDGTPDYLDLDSDNDGIPDADEAGEDPENPTDSDNDGVPDYRSTDSDGDGIPDTTESGNGELDLDQDGRIDAMEDPETADTDGDGMADGVATEPQDSDADGTPDFQDGDSDGDGIPDSVEAGEDPLNPTDTDGDGTPDYLDPDSDGDGVDDADEAGEDPANPTDTDGDGTPNYLDSDADGDGIPDSDEGDADTDSDGDGIPDWLDALGATISGQVYFDADRNGENGATESDISGVDVNLVAAGADGELGTDDDVVIRTVATASPYRFTDVPDGTYLLVIDTDTLPEGIYATADIERNRDQLIEVTVAGADMENQDFGEYYAAVSGTFRDNSGNPIANATVTFTDANGRVFTTTTGSDGSYFFEGSAAQPMALGGGTLRGMANNGTVVLRGLSVAGADVAVLNLATSANASGAIPGILAYSGSSLLPVYSAMVMIAGGVFLTLIGRRRRLS